MPIYDYHCPKCGAEDRAIRCIADHDKGDTCYRCGKAKMEQILGATQGIVKDPAVPPRLRRRP
jgi:putative FmdB family regulatory protein